MDIQPATDLHDVPLPERPASSTLPEGVPSLDETKSDILDRAVTRTPSPTPSEAQALQITNSWIFFDWRKYISPRWWLQGRRKWLLVVLAFVAVFVALLSIFHDRIVVGMLPASDWLRDTPGAWVIPIALLFIVSFPPLWGHEIIALICGLVWGLWIGFGIVAAGTFLGEIGNFYAFKYCCRSRCEKLEKKQIAYACLTRVVRQGGFRVVLVARYSAIPPHFSTAVFSTCGVGIISFSMAALLSLPRQMLNVYLGVIFLQTYEGGKSDKKVTYPLAVATILVTILAMWYILREMKRVRPEVIYARRKARQAKSSSTVLSALDSVPYLSAPSTSTAGRLSQDIELTASKASMRIRLSSEPMVHRDLESGPSDQSPGHRGLDT